MFNSVDAYDRHMGRYSGALALRLILRAGIEPGDRVLDVGCGPGGLTRELIALLGIDNVAAVEPSPVFFKAASERFAGLDVHNTGAESLPFETGSFDAALCQLVLSFMTDAHAGAAEMARVTRPGGSVAAAMWDYRGEMTLLRSFWQTATQLDPGCEDRVEGRMSYSTPEELVALWGSVGLIDVEAGPEVVSASYADFDDLWFGFTAGVGPAGAYVVQLPADERERLRTAYRQRLGFGDAPFELTARAWLVSGEVG